MVHLYMDMRHLESTVRLNSDFRRVASEAQTGDFFAGGV